MKKWFVKNWKTLLAALLVIGMAAGMCGIYFSQTDSSLFFTKEEKSDSCIVAATEIDDLEIARAALAAGKDAGEDSLDETPTDDETTSGEGDLDESVTGEGDFDESVSDEQDLDEAGQNESDSNKSASDDSGSKKKSSAGKISDKSAQKKLAQKKSVQKKSAQKKSTKKKLASDDGANRIDQSSDSTVGGQVSENKSENQATEKSSEKDSESSKSEDKKSDSKTSTDKTADKTSGSQTTTDKSTDKSASNSTSQTTTDKSASNSTSQTTENSTKKDDDSKTIQVTIKITDDRDKYYKTYSYKVKSGATLADVMLDAKIVSKYEMGQYGLYVLGIDGNEVDANDPDEYWWCLLDNGEFSNWGASYITVEDKDVFTWEMRQGYSF